MQQHWFEVHRVPCELLCVQQQHAYCCLASGFMLLVAGAACRFEGDGMVHATRIKDGAASFCNAWVDTHKLREEKRAGFPMYAKVRHTGLGVCLQTDISAD
jgi:hypothetical protein